MEDGKGKGGVKITTWGSASSSPVTAKVLSATPGTAALASPAFTQAYSPAPAYQLTGYEAEAPSTPQQTHAFTVHADHASPVLSSSSPAAASPRPMTAPGQQARPGPTLAWSAAAFETPQPQRKPPVPVRPGSASATSPSFAHATQGSTKQGPEFTTRPIGSPAVHELNPTSPSQIIRLKHRAATLIQKYAGAHWREAQRTKWMLDVVTHIDLDYRDYILDQSYQLAHLQDELHMQRQAHAASQDGLNQRVAELDTLTRSLESQLRDSNQTVLDLQARLAQAESALWSAESAAATAAGDCLELHQAVQVMAESHTRSRKALSHRAYELKQALRESQSKARQGTEAERRHKLEAASMVRVLEGKVLEAQRAMQMEFTAQVAAVHQVERAAREVEVGKVAMELTAYKEPWMYHHGKKSPTKDKALTNALNLIPTSVHTLHVPY